MFALVISFISFFAGIIIVKFNYFTKEYNPSSYLLAGYFIIFSIFGIANLVIPSSTNPTLVAIVFKHFTPLFVSIGPILYLYVRTTLNDRFHVSDKRNLIHLVPLIIFFVNIIPYLVMPFDYKIRFAIDFISGKSNALNAHNLLFSDYIASLLRQFVNFVYLICTLIFILKKQVTRPINLNQLKIISTWLRLFISSNILFCILMLLYLIENDIIKTNYVNKHSEIILYSCWIVYSGIILSIFLFPNILYGLPQIDDNLNSIQEPLIKKDYKPFELEDLYMLEIDSFMNSYINTHPYIHEKYSLSVLTADSKIPTHHLNFYFKEHLNTNFNTWKNELKINYAVDLIKNGSLDQLTIEAIALQSGFKSYSNFYAVFKQKTGLTPSEYIGKNKTILNLATHSRNNG